jgi:hypothetical protein
MTNPVQRRRLRSVLIAILVVLVAAGAHQLWDYIELRRLVAEIQAVQAAGDPVTERSAFQARRNALYFSGDTESSPAGRVYVAAGLAAVVPYSPLNAITVPLREWLAGAGPALSDGARERLRVLAADSADALMLADKASVLSYAGLPPGTEYNYRSSHLIALSHIMAGRTLSLSLSGDGDAAIASALSSLQLRRALKEVRWPSTGGHETGAILSLTRASAPALARLQQALEAEDAVDRIVDDLATSRAREIEQLWARHYGGDPHAPDNYRLPSRGLRQLISRPLTSRRAVARMRVWSDVIAAARKPWTEKLTAIAEVEKKHGLGMSDMPGTLFPERLLRFGAVTPAGIAIDRSAAAAIGVERFRRDHAEMLPDSLAQLVPRYLTGIPIDPFSGASLLYVKDDVSYTVYSVGSDRLDDRGDLISELVKVQKQGYGLRRLRGRDVGIRVLSAARPASAPPGPR